MSDKTANISETANVPPTTQHADKNITAKEALAASLSKRGYVDMAYIGSITGFPYSKLLSDLKDDVFLNVGGAPAQTDTYVTADKYLSGNLSEKLMHAKAAQAVVKDGSLDVNVTALEAAIQRNEIQKNEKEREIMSKYDISARVNPLKDQSGHVKAMASVTIDNVVAINDLTVVEGKNGHFVGFPQTKDKEGNFRDIVQFMKDESGKMTQESVDLKNAIQKTIIDLFKNNERTTPEKSEQDKKPVMHEIKAFVTPLRDSQNATKGLATVQVGELFKIASVRVNENTKEGSENFGKNFVSMPSRPDKTAESGYRDVVHAVTKEFSEKIRDTVLKQYDNQLAWKENAAKREQTPPQQEKPAANKSNPGIE
jgi:stage V sporulation protein G